MMSLQKNLGVLLFLLSVSSLLHSHGLSHAASTSPPVTRPRITFLTALGSDDDYEEEDDYENNGSPPMVLSSMKTPLLRNEPHLCHYDPCLENQQPCAYLATQTGCLCPGLSGDDEPPHAPRIQALLPIDEGDDKGKVEVKWCAPSSVVSGYRVVIQGRESDTLEVGDASRRGVLGSLVVGTKVCVEALNKAGTSTPSDFSCRRYDPPKSSDHELLVWIVGGGATLLVILIIVSVILWKRKTCQKGKRNSADGLGNPSYSTEGTL
ncbi:leucine-rich repeat neuronal protein 4 [Anabas testudineus]|uniref:Si:ch1073-303k11.2 n=1 Tax=Anabas testudineus TaxID=64144 RepID=A0A3Q1JW54_ANATE|nr:leucine-rich repeat neuronal protein 4 [Anabas testudineus]